MPERVLIVDDDAPLRESLELVLAAEGYEVATAADAESALRRIEDSPIDVVLCDLRMPGMDGLELLPHLVRRLPAATVILMSAYGTEDLAIEAMGRGAYDYLAKPFEPKELLLRINSILRRVPPAEPADILPKVLGLGILRYDVERGSMWDSDTPVRLTATESQLMRIFATCPGEPVSRAKLVEDLGRDGGQAQERAVDVQITRLRRKIEADPKQPRYLQTVRGAGYMLVPD